MIIGVIGLGYWGPNLVRNFLAQDGVSKVIACDALSERLKFVKIKCPAAELTNSSDELINGEADAIAIATPVDTHFSFAKKALSAGKHIWVEKPFTSNSAQAEELIELADKNNLKIFVYTGAVKNGPCGDGEAVFFAVRLAAAEDSTFSALIFVFGFRALSCSILGCGDGASVGLGAGDGVSGISEIGAGSRWAVIKSNATMRRRLVLNFTPGQAAAPSSEMQKRSEGLFIVLPGRRNT